MNQTPRYAQLAAAIAALLLLFLAWKFVVPEILAIIKYIFILMTPFLLATILSVFIEPMVKFAHFKLRLVRPLAVSLSMFVVIGGLGSLLFLVIFRLVEELSILSVSLPKYIGPVQDYISQLVERGKIFYFQLPPAVTDSVQERMGVVSHWLSNMTGSLANSLLRVFAAVPGTVTIIVVTLIATYFISRDRKEIVRFWLKYMPVPWGSRSVAVGQEIISAFLGYLRAQFVLISLTTIQSIVGLHIIGANYALTVGLLIGFFDLIPVLGPATIYIPWAVWAFISGNLSFGFKLLLLYVIVWAVRQTLEAKVIAATLGLHPLAVLIAMYAGLKAIGVGGLLLGPILLITIQAAIKAGLSTRFK